MTFLARVCIALASGLPLACAPTLPATLENSARVSGAERQFSNFCADWMENLRERERSNLAGIELQRVGSRLVGKYTG